MKNSVRGGSTFGCLFTLAVIAAVIYVGYRFALVQWDYEGMKEELTNITAYWATKDNPNPESIKNEIIAKAEKLGMTVYSEDIDVEPSDAMVSIHVFWTVPIEFPGGYVYTREFTVSRTVRR